MVSIQNQKQSQPTLDQKFQYFFLNVFFFRNLKNLYLLQKFLVVSKNIKTKMNIIVKTGGILLLLTGLLILTNQLQALGFYLLRYMPFLQNLG